MHCWMQRWARTSATCCPAAWTQAGRSHRLPGIFELAREPRIGVPSVLSCAASVQGKPMMTRSLGLPSFAHGLRRSSPPSAASASTTGKPVAVRRSDVGLAECPAATVSDLSRSLLEVVVPPTEADDLPVVAFDKVKQIEL